MKTNLNLAVLALLLSTLNPRLSTAFAQGSLTPPGAPAPTMKTLAQIEPRTPISALPTTITVSGSYYVTTNLTAAPGGGVNGITIQADDVAIDLNGCVLTGIGSDTGIIVSSPQKNLSVRNGTLRSWGFSAVDAHLASNSQFEQLRIANCGGAGLRTGTGGIATHCNVTANGSSGIEAGDGSTVKDCTAFANVNDGIVGSRGVSVMGCTVRGSGRYGIDVNDGSTVSGCTVTSNALHGIQVSSACRVTENLCHKNGPGASAAGILVSGSYNRIEANQVSGNTRGIDVQAGGNLIIKNHAADNPLGGGGANYIFTFSNTFGPTNNLVGPGGVITNVNPWANFTF